MSEEKMTKIDRTAIITQLYHEEKLSLQKIGDRFHLSRERVRQILKENNSPSNGKRKIILDSYFEISNDYKNRVSPQEIIAKYNLLSYPKLRSILNATETEIKPSGFFQKRNNYELVTKQIIADYISGMKPKDIAIKNNLNHVPEIYKFLRKEHIATRRISKKS